MEVNDLKKGMKFSDPDSNVHVRERDSWRWKPTEIRITNIRRYGEDPSEILVYYQDNGGNKWKADAEWFLNRYGDFHIEGKLVKAIKLLGQGAPTTPAQPDMTDPNIAAIPGACPICGYKPSDIEASEGCDTEGNMKCPRCGNAFTINTAPDEVFLQEYAMQAQTDRQREVEQLSKAKSNRRDARGRKIKSDQIYILQNRTDDRIYYGGGKFNDPMLVADPDMAESVTGNDLLSMEYDWQFAWNALTEKDWGKLPRIPYGGYYAKKQAATEIIKELGQECAKDAFNSGSFVGPSRNDWEELEEFLDREPTFKEEKMFVESYVNTLENLRG